MVAVALALAACGYDPPHGFLFLHNRSDQPVYVYQVRADTEDPLLAGPIASNEEQLFFTLPRGQECAQASTFAIRDEDGNELARRSMRADPVCDGQPWVWHGPDPHTPTP